VDTRPRMGARYYHMYNECCDGKVYIRPRMGASYYHMICCNSILHDPLSLFLLFCDMAIFSFFLGPSCVQLFFSLGPSCVHFFYSHVSFVILTWRERERDQHIVWSFIVTPHVFKLP
jgi:hypothetical protein